MAAKKAKEEALAPIIVKKITVVAAGHHGGAWKVAYADFVTAMMAFFLMLWLLGATTEDQRKGLADYFTPTLVKMREKSAGSDGVLGGSSINEVDNYPNRAGQTGTKSITVPKDLTGGPKEGAGKLNRMRRELEEKVEQNERLKKLMKQVRMVNTTEGIRIDLVDDADFSMFALGTTAITSDASQLLGAISELVGDEAGDLMIRGHTDALSFKDNRGANNWSLSAGRAEATRQSLMRHGIEGQRFQRIEGVADRELLIPDNPSDPRNRRVSILLAD